MIALLLLLLRWADPDEPVPVCIYQTGDPDLPETPGKHYW